MACMDALIALKSGRNLISLIFFFITETGEFQGLTGGLMCPMSNCSLTRFCNA